MSLSVSNIQGFIELRKEGVDFINYVLEKSDAPFAFSKEPDLEIMLDMLERHLKIKGKANADMQLLLYKVLKIKKQLKALHESLSDIEKNMSDKDKEAIEKAVCADISFEELEDLIEIFEKKPPKGDFYNYNAIRKALLRKLNGEIDDAFFKSWLILLCHLFNGEKFALISHYFDACSFINEYSTKEVLEKGRDSLIIHTLFPK